MQPDGSGVEEVVADRGYHSDETLMALDEVRVRSHVSEPERGRRCWQDKKTGETPPEKRAAQKALYANRRRVRGGQGRRLQRCRGEVVQRSFAHLYETGGMRRVWVRGHENVRKRVLIQAAACNIGLLLRHQTGVGTPRSPQGRAILAICRLNPQPPHSDHACKQKVSGVDYGTHKPHTVSCYYPPNCSPTLGVCAAGDLRHATGRRPTT